MSNLFLLKYDSENLGDDIQTIAVMDIFQEMSIQHSFVYRDLMSGYFFDPFKSNYIIFNGWFTNGYGLDTYFNVTDECKKLVNVTWPPKGNFIPILYSFHISEWGPADNRIVHPSFLQSSTEFYKSFGPVGCRDHHTLNILQNLDVESYFSGCITLSLSKEKYSKINANKNEVLLVDVDPSLKELLISKTVELYQGQVGFKNLTHSISPYSIDLLDRFTLARRHLEAFANAKLVFTSRLHVALPCLAFGTPVIFVVDDNKVTDARLVDYLPWLNVLKHSEAKDACLENLLMVKYDKAFSVEVKEKFQNIIRKAI